MEAIIKLGVLVFGLAVVVAVVALFTLPLVVFQAYVISDLWGLFVIPWIGIELPVSLWTTAGLLLTIRVAAQGIDVSSKKDKNKKDDESSWTDHATPLVLSYFVTLVTWGMGHFYYWLST